jgi:trans-2,3-dihydro-3-hydroxyanthranilate isomerase
MSLPYVHVDVFGAAPYGGNSLAVFPDARGLSARQMLRITQELRHFESVFLEPTADESVWNARVFDLFEELPFAGHPLLGAAAVLHRRSSASTSRAWKFNLAAKTVSVNTQAGETGVRGDLSQGKAEMLGVVEDRDSIASALSLDARDLVPDLPLAVVNTGLKYLVVPVVTGALRRARIAFDLTATLQKHGAQFAVVLDDATPEQRHWNNDGIVEDVATGSAAGVVGAYRLKYKRAEQGRTFALRQGRFVGRPSILYVTPRRTESGDIEVCVGGNIAFVGRGELEVLPV